MVTLSQKGDWKKTESFLKRVEKMKIDSILRKYGTRGVSVLSAATPKDSGRTAASWRYEIEKNGSGFTVTWCNDNVNKGVNIALILQYGHGTRNGGYVAGRDYINPAIVPVLEKMANDAWLEVLGNG